MVLPFMAEEEGQTGNGGHVYTDGSLTFTTRIETPVTLWRSIAAGEIRGDEALMQGLYKVKGDFTLMLKWDTFFGSPEPQTKEKEMTPVQKKTNMNAMLLPWMALWIFTPIAVRQGSLVSIGVCALVPLLFCRNKKTLYDILSNTLVTGISLMLLAGVPEKTMLPLSYLAFGVMWLSSCPGNQIPLTANYSMNSYGGEAALKNPLFLKTNRILTMLWGILYLLDSIFTWFQRWYPAKVANGK